MRAMRGSTPSAPAPMNSCTHVAFDPLSTIAAVTGSSGELDHNRDERLAGAALQQLDAELVEMRRCKKKGLCCGAGGAQMFKDAEPGTAEVNHLRSKEALDTQPKIIATGCPFCNTMMTDGVKHHGAESEVDVKDIAELIADAANLI